MRRTNAEAKNGLEAFIIDTRDKMSEHTVEEVRRVCKFSAGLQRLACGPHMHMHMHMHMTMDMDMDMGMDMDMDMDMNTTHDTSRTHVTTCPCPCPCCMYVRMFASSPDFIFTAL